MPETHRKTQRISLTLPDNTREDLQAIARHLNRPSLSAAVSYAARVSRRLIMIEEKIREENQSS